MSEQTDQSRQAHQANQAQKSAHRLEVALRPGLTDTVGRRVAAKIREELGLAVDEVRVVRVYTTSSLTDEEARRLLEVGVVHDPVLHEVSSLPPGEPLASGFDWIVEVGFKPGVTDNEGRTAREAIALVLGLDETRKGQVAVFTSIQYLLKGSLSAQDVERIASGLLANDLIQRHRVKSAAEWSAEPGFSAQEARVTGRVDDTVEMVPVSAMSEAELMDFSRKNTLALSLTEMLAIKAHFADPEVSRARSQAGLGVEPTDAEIEILAQTWSEHCKHKIFQARIDYENRESGRRERIDSLYKTFIKDTTAAIRARMGKDDFCLSVFKDNAGVIRFDDDHSVCIKVETHNSPSALDPYGGALTGIVGASALDPYGGALTGIVGVNRDPMGTGMGANLLCNTDVFCFASPFHEGELPPRLLHPRRIFEGVREGVEHGGNKSGIPTVNGAIVFDERYLGKPLVYCGTVGIMPAMLNGRPSHEKEARPGDRIVMAGGRIGKDGIHGATFSSEELHEGSPATAVQIGDPITQRKMYDFLMRARDLGLYTAITDNGAGGLSSSVGEMATGPGGCELDLARAPLKYDGLRPWEILLSEAQERMTLAVPPECLDRFLALAKEMDVEATDLGRFTDSGVMSVRYRDKPVAWLGMDFLHEGAPQMELSAEWTRPRIPEGGINTLRETALDHDALLKRMLGRLNICSREYVIRQYDHEVQGGSAVKPLVGVNLDGPADAGVIRPVLDLERGLVIANGICPKFSDLDTYWMMAGAIDEAVRNAVAVGADLRHMAGVDNFCWCDPVQSEKTPDGRYKLAQLVRANQALAHFCQAYGVPCISGKDSMKNDYTGGGVKISIPPTVLFSVLAVIPDVSRAQTSDFKRPGDLVYVLGLTRSELGASELASELGITMASVPQVDAVPARERYLALHQAIHAGLVTACHDVSDGGLAVALAEMAIGGRLGARIDADLIPAEPGLTLAEKLYSESASRFVVTVRPEAKERFEALLGSGAGGPAALVGEVGGPSLVVAEAQRVVLDTPAEELAQAFKATLAW